jgi:choline dehydrogenase-like flavoprotein
LSEHRAIKTPQLLELSGIGDKDVLEKAGIPVKLDLPSVGNNVQGVYDFSWKSWYSAETPLSTEHMVGSVTFELTDEVSIETVDALRDPATAAKHTELR